MRKKFQKSIIFQLVVLVLPCFVQAQFTNVTAAAGIQQVGKNRIEMGGGSAWLDYDGDGDEDLIAVGGLGDNKLWRNNGDGTFSDVTALAGLSSIDNYDTQGVVTGDIDNDGYREIFISTLWHQPNLLFHNEANGTFTDISISSGIGIDSMWCTSAAFGDFDLDGYLDLYRGNYVWLPVAILDSTGYPIGYAHRCNPNSLFRNNGNGTFSDLSSLYQVGDTGCALAVVFTDYDQDHDGDILIANDFGAWVSPSILYQNQMPGPFADVSVGTNMNAQMYGMGIAVGDYDHDSDLDYYVTNIGPNALFQQQANHTFMDVAGAAGVLNDSVGQGLAIGWGDAWLDYDNDTWQDLFVSNGYIQLIPIFQGEREDPNVLYRNLGNGTFVDMGLSLGVADTNAGRGMSMADFDQDGDLDAFVSVVNQDTNGTDPSVLYRNDQQAGNHWLQVQLQGTYSNRDAFGAQMLIRVNGQRWLHEVNGGSSHCSQHSSIAHFGTGQDLTVDSLYVIWPSGNVQLLTEIPVDQRILVIEDSASFLAVAPPSEWMVEAFPNPFSNFVDLKGRSTETGWLQIRCLDLQGRLLQEASIPIEANGSFQTRIDAFDAYPAGIYFLELRANDLGTRLKICKQ